MVAICFLVGCLEILLKIICPALVPRERLRQLGWQ